MHKRLTLFIFTNAKVQLKICQKEHFSQKKRKRAREHGFIKRMASKAGQRVIKRRRLKGRKKLTA